MSKMNELSIDFEGYDAYTESLREELRNEGMEEFRIELRRILRTHMEYETRGDYYRGLDKALTIIEKTSR